MSTQAQVQPYGTAWRVRTASSGGLLRFPLPTQAPSSSAACSRCMSAMSVFM